MAVHLLLWAGAAPNDGARWLGLSLTYALHALLWGALAARVCRARRLPAATENLCWKLSLLGPLLTTLAAASLPGGSTELEPLTQGAAVVLNGRGGAAALLDARDAFASLRLPVHYLAVGAGVVAALSVLRFGVSLVCLWRRLRNRKPVKDARLLRRFAQVRALGFPSAVTLTEDPALVSPLVLGRNEVCLPLASWVEFSDAQLDALFAHELSHVQRADGVWFPLVGLLDAAFCLHPVTRWVAGRFRESAEFACDERAVAMTGDAFGLARALVQFASRGRHLPHPTLAPGMQSSPSTLVARVARLTQARLRAEEGPALAVRFRPLLLALVGLAAAWWNVDVVQAKPAKSEATETAQSRLIELARAERSPADATELFRQHSESLLRARHLEAQLAQARLAPSAAVEGSPAAVRILELGQALRHAHETALWLEQSLAEVEEPAMKRNEQAGQ